MYSILLMASFSGAAVEPAGLHARLAGCSGGQLSAQTARAGCTGTVAQRTGIRSLARHSERSVSRSRGHSKAQVSHVVTAPVANAPCPAVSAPPVQAPQAFLVAPPPSVVRQRTVVRQPAPLLLQGGCPNGRCPIR